MIKMGQNVTIKPEWRDPGDEKYQWRAVTDEVDGHLMICPWDSPLAIKPHYSVESFMLEEHRPPKPYQVELIWYENWIEQCDNEPEPVLYEFDTQEELNAFIKGANAALPHCDYRHVRPCRIKE